MSLHRDELENQLVGEIEAAYAEQKDIAQFVQALSGILGASAAETMRVMYTTTLDRKIRAIRAQGARIVKYANEKLQAPKDWDQFHELLNELGKRLREPYRFNIYAAGRRSRSVNFGIVTTYRQRWTPTTYQVGEMVRTVPLAPKEVRRYSRKLVRKLTQEERDSRSTLDSIRSETKSTVRAESEIIAKARSRGNYAFEAKAGMKSWRLCPSKERPNSARKLNKSRTTPSGTFAKECSLQRRSGATSTTLRSRQLTRWN